MKQHIFSALLGVMSGRAREPSTWAGLAGAISSAGWGLTAQDTATLIASSAGLVASVAAIALREKSALEGREGVAVYSPPPDAKM